MKKILVLALLIFSSPAYSAVITGFGTSEFTPTTSDFFATQTSSSYQILGTDFGNSFTGNVSLVNLGASPYILQLNGSFSGTATSTFQIRLFDNTVAQNSATFQGNFSDYTPQGTFKALTLSPVSQAVGFNNQVAKIAFLTSGTGGSVNFTLDTLSTTAVPEPSTTGYMVIVGVVLVSFRLRSKKASSNL